MGKLLDRINQQDDGEDKTEVLKIYNKLISLDGHVWSSDFDVLVKTSFIGKYPNYRRYYSPSKVYKVIRHCEQGENYVTRRNR